MKIGVAGGLGFEEKLVRALGGHSITLVGSGYDIKKERFAVPSGTEFTGEYLTHNYSEQMSGQDILIDVSDSLKSKYTLNDLSVKFKKKFISVICLEGWKVALVDPASGGGCLQCLAKYSKPLPLFVFPALPEDKALETVASSLSASGSSVIDLSNGEKKSIPLEPDCAGTRGVYRFANGEMADVTAVSCSDVSVAITPMNELALDLAQYKTLLAGHAKIVKLSPYTLQFKIGKFDCTLFRLGRMVVKGTKEKNTALYLYRNFIGS